MQPTILYILPTGPGELYQSTVNVNAVQFGAAQYAAGAPPPPPPGSYSGPQTLQLSRALRLGL